MFAVFAGLALCLPPSSSPALADQLPTRIVVDGKPVAYAGAVPSLRNGQLWVPLFPVARELLDTVEVDAANQTIRVLLSHNGETRSFVRTTGEIRREGAIMAIIPGASELVVAPRPEDQQTPLDVLSLLLDVSVQVDGETGTILVRRESLVASAEPSFRRTSPIDVSEVRYSESMTRNDAAYGNLLSLFAQGQLYDGAFMTRVDLAGGTDQGNVNLLGGAASLSRAGGQVWTAGDMSLGATSPFLAGPARGVSLDQTAGGSRVRLFAGGALSGVGLGLGGSGQRHYETDVGAVTWMNETLARNGPGAGVGVGAVSFSGPDGSGSMIVHHLGVRSRRSYFVLDAAAGEFGDDPHTGAKGGADGGLETTEYVDIGRSQVAIRGAYYGDKLLTAQVNNALRARSLFGLSWSGALSRRWTGGLSATRTWVRLPQDYAATTFTVSGAYSHPVGPLPEISFFHTLMQRDNGSDQSTSQLDLARTIGAWRPFLSYNRIGQDSSAINSGTVGTNVDFAHAGSFRLAASATEKSRRGGAVDWTSPLLADGRFQVGAGLGYERPQEAAGLREQSRVATRLLVQGRLPGGHSLQMSYQDTGESKHLLITLAGPIFAARRDARLAPDPAVPAFTLPSSIVGRLYEDANRNGHFDPGEDVPLPRVRLWLDGSLVAVTGETGQYRYDGVPAGAHTVSIDFASVSAVLTPLGELSRSLNLPARVEYTVDFGFSRTGGVGGQVFFDANRNGVLDAGEIPVPDIRVICSCGRDTLTTVDGTFVLGDLAPGTVYITLDLQGLPDMYVAQPERLEATVVAGRQTYDLRIAVQRVDRPIEERAAELK